MPHTIIMMFAVENYLVSEGCTILGSSAKKLGPVAKKVIPGSLIEQANRLPAVGLKRFVQHKDQGFLVHVYIDDWPDGVGATVNIHTYGAAAIKLAEACPAFYIDLEAGKFLHRKNISSLFNPSPVQAL